MSGDTYVKYYNQYVDNTSQVDTAWTPVVKAKKKLRKPQVVKVRKTREEIINILETYFNKFENLIALYVYGSVARDQHTINSDVDIITFWKYEIDNDTNDTFKKELTQLLGMSVHDLNCYKYNKTCVYKKGYKRLNENFLVNAQVENIKIIDRYNLDPLETMHLE